MLQNHSHPLAPQFDNLFRGRRDAHGSYDLSRPDLQAGGKVKGKGKTEKIPEPTDALWLELWSQHLSGATPSLGVFPSDESGQCTWGCIDVDSKFKIDPETIKAKIQTSGHRLLVCRSKSPGAFHVYFFVEKPVSALDMRNFLEKIRGNLGLPDSVEVFPKVDADTDTELPGGWVNMPFFGEERAAL